MWGYVKRYVCYAQIQSLSLMKGTFEQATAAVSIEPQERLWKNINFGTSNLIGVNGEHIEKPHIN